MQNFVKGLSKVAKKGKRKASNKQVVKFQDIKKEPNQKPKIKKLQKFTSPKYSGERNKYFAPNKLAICPEINRANNIQIPINIRLLRRCNSNN